MKEQNLEDMKNELLSMLKLAKFIVERELNKKDLNDQVIMMSDILLYATDFINKKIICDNYEISSKY